MKKGFSLLEILIVIGIFFILLLFLYQFLDLSKKNHTFYEKKLNHITNETKLKTIFIEDIFEARKITITTDINGNSIVSLETTNLYHEQFFNHVTYVLSKEKNLLRIESSKPFNKTNLSAGFFDNAYIDRLQDKVSRFEISPYKKNPNAYSILIQTLQGKKILLFSAIKMN